VQKQMKESSSESWKAHAQSFLDELKLLKKQLSGMQERAGISDGEIAWHPFYSNSQKFITWKRDNVVYFCVKNLPNLSPWERWCAYRQLGSHKTGSYQSAWQSLLYSRTFAIDMLRKGGDAEALQEVHDYYLDKKIKEDQEFDSLVNAKSYSFTSLWCKTLYYLPWGWGKSIWTGDGDEGLSGNEFLPVVQDAFDKVKKEHALALAETERKRLMAGVKVRS